MAISVRQGRHFLTCMKRLHPKGDRNMHQHERSCKLRLRKELYGKRSSCGFQVRRR